MSISPSIDREGFLRALALRFAEIAESITDIESGLLHPEMAVVSHATQKAIEARSWQTVAAHFSFIAGVFAGGTAEVRNAVCVSYLENLFLDEASGNHVSTRATLPPVLASALVDLENHFEMLSHAKHGA